MASWRGGCAGACRPLGQNVGVFDATNGAVDLNHYVNHPLVRLASLETPPLNWLQTQIANAPGALRQEAGLPVADDPLVVPVAVSRRHCQLLRERGSVEAFLLLLALARHAELTGDFDAHRAPAQAAWDLLPRVVASTPWLQGNWRALAACLHRVIWSRDYGNGLLAAPPLPKLIENVLSMLRDPQVSLHLLIGPVEPLSREVVRQLVHVRWQIEQFECAEPMPDTIASLCSRLDGLICYLHAVPDS